MKELFGHVLVILFLFAPTSQYGSLPENLEENFSYEVFKVYAPVSITKEELLAANTLIDLNERYQEKWVKEYISVEITTTYNGKTRKAVSKNDVLTEEQKARLIKADIGSNISVDVRYMPDNTLKVNDVKEMNFSFIVEPDSEASFLGGEDQLKEYLKNNVRAKVSEDDFKQYQLAAVKFTVTESGEVTNAHIFWSSDSQEIDKLLLESVCNMPQWQPAEYEDGTRVQQEYVLTVGDLKSCVTNLLNIRIE